MMPDDFRAILRSPALPDGRNCGPSEKDGWQKVPRTDHGPCWTSNHEAVSKGSGRDVRNQSSRIPSSWRDAMRMRRVFIPVLVATVLIATSCSEPPAPPGPPPPGSLAEAPWAKDFAHQSFVSPLSLADARQILIRTDIFEFGMMPPKRQVQAFNAVLDQSDALLQFETVVRRGNLAGKLYAMCGFLLLEAQHGTSLRSALGREQSRVLVIEHDVIRGSMTVADIVSLVQRDQLCGAMRAAREETVKYFQSPVR